MAVIVIPFCAYIARCKLTDWPIRGYFISTINRCNHFVLQEEFLSEQEEMVRILVAICARPSYKLQFDSQFYRFIAGKHAILKICGTKFHPIEPMSFTHVLAITD